MKIGPARNSKSPSRWFQIDEPVTSAGSRSGVNWTRLKPSPLASANERAVSVFARPGTSSSRTWPSARMPSRIELELLALADDGALDLVDEAGAELCELAELHQIALQRRHDAAELGLVDARAVALGRLRPIGPDELPDVVAERRARAVGLAFEVDARGGRRGARSRAP